MKHLHLFAASPAFTAAHPVHFRLCAHTTWTLSHTRDALVKRHCHLPKHALYTAMTHPGLSLK
jgi:hypothetical protein